MKGPAGTPAPKGAPPRVHRLRGLKGEDIPRSDRRHFVRARLESRGGTLIARTTGAQGSHLISSLQGASCLLVIMEGEGVVRQGDTVSALLLNDALPWGNA